MLETLESLFGNQLGEVRNGRLIKACMKCGALAVFHNSHVNWHNEVKDNNNGTA